MVESQEVATLPRVRRRSRRRKLLESLALVVGVPALLFTVLALSVQLIEYRTVAAQADAPQLEVASVVIDIPPVRTRSLGVHPTPRSALDLDAPLGGAADEMDALDAEETPLDSRLEAALEVGDPSPTR